VLFWDFVGAAQAQIDIDSRVASLAFLPPMHTEDNILALITQSEEPKVITITCSSRYMPNGRALLEPTHAHTSNKSIPCMAVHLTHQQIATAASGEVKLWTTKAGNENESLPPLDLVSYRSDD
jgi:hypothetical protein